MTDEQNHDEYIHDEKAKSIARSDRTLQGIENDLKEILQQLKDKETKGDDQ